MCVCFFVISYYYFEIESEKKSELRHHMVTSERRMCVCVLLIEMNCGERLANSMPMNGDEQKRKRKKRKLCTFVLSNSKTHSTIF